MLTFFPPILAKLVVCYLYYLYRTTIWWLLNSTTAFYQDEIS